MVTKQELQLKFSKFFEIIDNNIDLIQQNRGIFWNTDEISVDNYWTLYHELGEIITSVPELMFACYDLSKTISQNTKNEKFANKLEGNESYQKLIEIIGKLVIL